MMHIDLLQLGTMSDLQAAKVQSFQIQSAYLRAAHHPHDLSFNGAFTQVLRRQALECGVVLDIDPAFLVKWTMACLIQATVIRVVLPFCNESCNPTIKIVNEEPVAGMVVYTPIILAIFNNKESLPFHFLYLHGANNR